MQGFLADDDAGDTVGDGRDGWGRGCWKELRWAIGSGVVSSMLVAGLVLRD